MSQMITKDYIDKLSSEEKVKFAHIVEKGLSKKAMLKLHLMKSGWHFDEATARMAVNGMVGHNSSGDKICGEKFNKEYTDAQARELGITFKTYNSWDWYFVMNMVYSDYSRCLNPQLFRDVAKAWIEDEDVPEGKAFRYWIKVVKWW